MAGAKTKYDINTFPLLAESYARDGHNDEQIAKKLGISLSAFYNYQQRHMEFMEAIKRGKAPVDFEVENSLLKRAKGFEYEEVTKEVEVLTNGELKVKSIKTVKKYTPPETAAMAFWLKNRQPKKWMDKQEIDHSNKDGSLSRKTVNELFPQDDEFDRCAK
jgi:transposase